MVYVTGDTHGELARFQSREMKALRAGDTLVVLGDFGFIWNGSAAEAQNLRWLAKRPYKILFLPGTHDNYDLLEQYPETPFQGGMARHIEGNLSMLCSGHIFDLEGK